MVHSMLHAPLLRNPLEINSPCRWIRTPPSPPSSGVLTCYCQGLLDFLIISSLHAPFLHPNRTYHLQFRRANQQTINVPTISGWVGIGCGVQPTEGWCIRANTRLQFFLNAWLLWEFRQWILLIVYAVAAPAVGPSEHRTALGHYCSHHL